MDDQYAKWESDMLKAIARLDKVIKLYAEYRVNPNNIPGSEINDLYMKTINSFLELYDLQQIEDSEKVCDALLALNLAVRDPVLAKTVRELNNPTTLESALD